MSWSKITYLFGFGTILMFTNTFLRTPKNTVCLKPNECDAYLSSLIVFMSHAITRFTDPNISHCLFSSARIEPVTDNWNEPLEPAENFNLADCLAPAMGKWSARARTTS